MNNTDQAIMAAITDGKSYPNASLAVSRACSEMGLALPPNARACAVREVAAYWGQALNESQGES